VTRLDDRHGRFHVEVITERADDRLRQILLQHEPMREHIDETRDPTQPRHAIFRQKRDVRFTLGGEHVVRAHEQHRDLHCGDGTPRIYRKTPTERRFRTLVMTGEEHVGQRTDCRPWRRSQRGIHDVDTECLEQVTHRTLGADEIWGGAVFGSCHQRSRTYHIHPSEIASRVDTLRCLP
jgi:hypothetical protein